MILIDSRNKILPAHYIQFIENKRETHRIFHSAKVIEGWCLVLSLKSDVVLCHSNE